MRRLLIVGLSFVTLACPKEHECRTKDDCADGQICSVDSRCVAAAPVPSAPVVISAISGTLPSAGAPGGAYTDNAIRILGRGFDATAIATLVNGDETWTLPIQERTATMITASLPPAAASASGRVLTVLVQTQAGSASRDVSVLLGAPGPTGAAGAPGETGAAGQNGSNGATGHTGDTGPAASILTGQQLGMLRWYQAIQTGATVVTVGNAPRGIAFDGTNLWVANTAGSVTRFDPKDGSATSFPAGGNPRGILFDGASIWVNNGLAGVTGTTTKLNASTGAIQGTFNTGDFNPQGVPGIAFDGANIWVAQGANNSVGRFKASDGSGKVDIPVGTNPYGIAFDGAAVWVSNSGDNTVSKIRVSDNQVFGPFAVGTAPTQVAFDGTHVWVANSTGTTVTRLRASDGGGRIDVPVGPSPYGLCFDGVNLWVSNNVVAGTVRKLRASDGADLGTYNVGTFPKGIAFDGKNIWVVSDGTPGTVMKL